MSDWRGESISELRSWCEALTRHASPSGAQISIAPPRGFYEPQWAALQGFARPLWGMASLALSGEGDKLGEGVWELWRRGFVAGTDPDHREFWGQTHDNCQAFCEMAPLALALLWARRELWECFSKAEQTRIFTWLASINRHDIHRNNWRCFRMLVNAAFLHLDGPVDQARLNEDREVLESLAGADGWSIDGKMETQRTVDHYIPSAFQTYGLLLSELLGESHPQWARAWQERAEKFASDWQWFVNSEGAQIAWGRSLSYRWAAGSLWSACAWANRELLPWRLIAWQWRSQRRWWSHHNLLRADGCLSLGYAYPTEAIAEKYIADESPYWLSKIWLALRRPASHPFWSGPEYPPSGRPRILALETAGAILTGSDENPVLLMAGQWGPEWMEDREARYGKFAYDTLGGFHFPDHAGLTPDNTLLVRPIGSNSWHARGKPLSWSVEGGIAHTTWSPFPGTTIESTLTPLVGGHRTSHHIVTDIDLETLEGGFPDASILDELESTNAFSWKSEGCNLLRKDSRIPVLERRVTRAIHDLQSFIPHPTRSIL